MRLTKSKNGKKSKLKASNTQFLKELKRGVKGITLLALVVTMMVVPKDTKAFVLLYIAKLKAKIITPKA